jgi:thiol:disulfide interchange protein DsbG
MFSKLILHRHLYASLSVVVSLMLMAGCSQAENAERPKVLQALETQGLHVVQEFDISGDLRAFAGVAGYQPVAVYVTSDGSAIVGTRLDDSGESVDAEMLQNLVAKPMSDKTWAQLEAATWVLDGNADAPRIVYTFSDANCPYCNRFWQAARPWVDAGKVQLRHVFVGVIKADSSAKAAAILQAPDPSTALLENERKFAQGGITPAKNIQAEVQKALDDNQVLMGATGFRGTPGIVVRESDGQVNKFNSMPRQEQLVEVLGEL